MKNLVLEHIKNQMDDTRAAADAVLATMKDEAKKIFELQMEFKKVKIKEFEDKLNSSKELGDVEGDEYPHKFIRVDLSELIDTENEFEREMLQEFLMDGFSIHVDFENDVLSMSEGPCILVNEQGDVLDQDSGKWIVDKNEYETVEKRNSLIEAWMEKSGYFPSVIQLGRYGDMRYIDTKA